MTRFHFERPDGPPSNNAQNILVHLNEFVPPQGYGGVAPVVDGLLLDLFPGAAAAYSFRELSSSYFGAAIRVKRTSDSTELDIGFVNGGLDVAALQAFVGSSDGLITIHYDQSGNGLDLDVQILDVRLPRIIIAGVLQQSNALEAVDYDGIDDVLVSTLSLPSPANQLFRFGLWQKTILGNNPTNYNLDAPNESNIARVSTHASFNTGAIFLDDGNTTTGRVQTGESFNDLLQHQYTFVKFAGVNNHKIRRDGTELAAQTQGTPSTVVSKIAIGNFGDGGNNPAAMLWQEFIVYLINVSSDISNIENNVSNYWTQEFLRITSNGDQRITAGGDERVFN